MRTMLLPLTDEERDQRSIEMGLTLSGLFDAYLTTLFVRPELTPPVYAHSVTAAGYAVLIGNLRDDVDVREAKAKEAFLAAAGERAVDTPFTATAPDGPRASFEAATGNEDEVIARYAAVHDLIIFPRSSGQPGQALPASSLLKSALEYSGRPTLIITDDLSTDFGSVVVIAWNGSSEGALAVTAALPVLARAEQVIILTVASGTTKGDEGERLRNYLAYHGVEASVEKLDEAASVGQELISGAVRVGAGLIVTGAYTHSRIRQILFGGVTHHLLENCRLPMLMAH